jgi:2-methylisocitrate lyase-like PEP mutase family enzyme
MPTQGEKAARLRELHRPGDPLVLVNAWDAASARLAVAAGAPAVATSSAAAANQLGYPDGQAISRDEMLAAVGVIARAVEVPVTADMEAGYGDDAGAARATALGVTEAGAVGLNLEDTADAGGLLPVERFVEKIAAVRAVGEETGIPLVLNARTDVFIRQIGDPDTRLDHSVERGRAYLAAGADCVFVPAVVDEATIGALARGIDGPVSVLATAATPTVPVLARLGVARISLGPGPYRAALTAMRRMAEEVYGMGTFSALADVTLTHADVQQLLA